MNTWMQLAGVEATPKPKAKVTKTVSTETERERRGRVVTKLPKRKVIAVRSKIRDRMREVIATMPENHWFIVEEVIADIQVEYKYARDLLIGMATDGEIVGEKRHGLHESVHSHYRWFFRRNPEYVEPPPKPEELTESEILDLMKHAGIPEKLLEKVVSFTRRVEDDARSRRRRRVCH